MYELMPEKEASFSAGRRVAKLQSISWWLTFSALILTSFLATGCPDKLVVIPPAEQDKPPEITINASPSAGNGRIETGKENISSASIVNVDFGMQMTIIGGAKNLGGVQSFSIEITQSGKTLYKVDTTNIRDASNKVPDNLRILGTNGTGGTGNNPLTITMSQPVEVITTASNFNNKPTSFKIIYVPVEPTERGQTRSTRISLKRQFGTNLFSAEFPEMPASGKLIAFGEPDTNFILFPKVGHSAAECFNDANATVALYQNGQTYPNELQLIYGSAEPVLPVKIDACARLSGDTVQIRVSYILN